MIPAPDRQQTLDGVNIEALAGFVAAAGQATAQALRHAGLVAEVDHIVESVAWWRATRRVPAPRTPSELTVEQAAEMLGVHPRTIRRWVVSGRLDGAQPSGTRGHHRVTAASVRRLQRSR